MAYLGNSPINRLYSTQAITLAQGQTTVNVTYTPGMCLVFKNGVLLDPGTDYTATNGSVITLAKAASTGDLLRVINLSQFAVANALALTGGTLSGPVTGPASSSETSAGLIKIATTLLAQGLTDDATALTPKKLADAFKGSSQSLGLNGYQKLPGGVILQWGNATIPSGSPGTANITLPVSFPSQCLIALSCSNGNPGTVISGAQTYGTGNPSAITLYASAGSAQNQNWIAIGI